MHHPLQLKDHIMSDLNPSALDAILDAFRRNTVCQALYIQNISEALLEKQFSTLLGLLKMKRIWALNIGKRTDTTAPRCVSPSQLSRITS